MSGRRGAALLARRAFEGDRRTVADVQPRPQHGLPPCAGGRRVARDAGLARVARKAWAVDEAERERAHGADRPPLRVHATAVALQVRERLEPTLPRAMSFVRVPLPLLYEQVLLLLVRTMAVRCCCTRPAIR